MTPERWREVDAILQGALACEPDRQQAFVAQACGDDEALRREVESLLAAGVGTGGFLERADVVEPLDAPPARPLVERLAAALAGEYAIERELARGGMATVFLARDLRHQRLVAIKVLRDEVAAAVGAERFLAEIRVTASLQHPHVLSLFDSGCADGLLWYAMPFVDGETLRSCLTRVGALPVAEAMRLAREIADALEHAHLRGVVHRDVKPENVLLQDGHAVVADFGIALALEQAGGERLTRTGLALGTPQYMAPEQAAGERALDARVDVYALGAVLHEMLAGEPPFAAASRQAVVQRLMHEPPLALTIRRPDVSPAVDAAVRRSLSKRPDDRFPSVAAFMAALEAPLAAPMQPLPHGRRVSARAALYAAAAALALGLAGGALLDRAWLARGSADNAQPATAAMPRVGAPLAVVGVSRLTVVDRDGRMLHSIPATRAWTPRFSRDGHRVAFGAFGEGRETSDLWVTDLDAGTTRRLTDGDADANDPQWSPDGKSLAYSVSAPGGKDVVLRALEGGGERVLAPRNGTQFPSDWLRDGSAPLVTDETASGRGDILVQPTDGSAARRYIATSADETGARMSPDGRWVAYTSDASGRAEVYLESYPQSGHRVMISTRGGIDPVWRGDGRELFYWRDGALVAVPLGAPAGDAAPVRGAETILFRAPYERGVSTMYDVSPDGKSFVLARQR